MSKKSTVSSAPAIAYYRVSTARQGASGLGLEAQRDTVTRYAAANGFAISGEHVEIETGTAKRRRPVLAKALAQCKQTGATLLIAKLDRLARNVFFVSGLMESGIPFVACDNPSVTPLTLHVLAAVAEQEAKAISTRTREALAAVKRRGVKLGTPANLTADAQRAGAEVNRDKAKDAYATLNGYLRILRCERRMSYAEIAVKLNEDGMRTTKGQTFLAMTVMRMCKRAGLTCE